MTGIRFEGKAKFNADLPEPSYGNHYWIWTVAYKCQNPEEKEQVHLDQENLLTIQGPGCLHCEQPYTPQLALRRCKPI